jgi:phosphotransferase system HPr-like phosphotransfer protein
MLLLWTYSTEEVLNEFKDFREITLMAKKHKTIRGRSITALITAQAKQEETLEWQY